MGATNLIPGNQAFELGSTLTMAYMGDLVAFPDGSEWIANTVTAPFDYTSTYASAPTNLLSPFSLIEGPYADLWLINAQASLAYKAADTLYCTGNSSVNIAVAEGDATNGFIYYTSANAGSTWTRRTYPNNKNYATAFTAGTFVGFAINSTTNAIITGTDAVSWSSVTGLSQSTVSDIVSDGSLSIGVFPQSGTTANYTLDGGTIWLAATITAPQLGARNLNQGGVTWNAGAGLYIGNVGTVGQYQTSPTFATWTLRSTIATYQPYGLFFGVGCLYASSATVTVAMGASGFFATTTDGLTWANHGWIAAGLPTLGLNAVIAFCHDGTRFVVLAADRTFYSTNGTSWTEGRRSLSTGTTNTLVANGRVVKVTNTGIPSKAFLITDPTLTAPLTVSALASNGQPGSTNLYTRIK